MARTEIHPASDAFPGKLLRRQSDLDTELKDIQPRTDPVEIRSARPLLRGQRPGPRPELPKLIERRTRLFDELRLVRRAISMAKRGIPMVSWTGESRIPAPNEEVS